jgi:hypothetical protein
MLRSLSGCPWPAIGGGKEHGRTIPLADFITILEAQALRVTEPISIADCESLRLGHAEQGQ